MKNKLSVRVSKIIFCTTTALLAEAVFSHSTYAEYSLGLTTSSSQTIDVSSNGSGTAISKTEINVTTTCQSGYNLSLSTTVSDNRLYLNGDSGNLSTGNYFSPSDGITDLVSADNTWGYYLPDADDTAPTVDSVFSAVPTLGSAATLRTPAQTASDTGINDTFSIYYGIKVTNAIIPGSYTMVKDSNETPGTLVYYATLPEDCLRYTIEYNPTGTNMGTSVTGIGSIDNQYIPEGATVALTSEVYESPTIDDVTYYFTGWNTAQDGTGTQYASGQSVTDLATAGNVVTLYAQWTDCTSGGICYHKNSVSAEGTMGKQALLSTDTTATLLASNFSYEGNGFAGWNTARDYSGNFYGPNETISFEAGQYTDGDEGLSLYAVWVTSEGAIQGWNGCDNLSPTSYNAATGLLSADLTSIVALTDMRDGQTYAVARLADGNCWMIENLRLSSGYTIDESASSLSQGYGISSIYGDFIGLADAENSNFANTTTANSIYGINTGSAININAIDSPSFRLPRYNNANTVNRASSPNTSNLPYYGFGNYYNWSAAIASTKKYTSGYIDDDQESSKSNLAHTSLCPTGWRMPYGSAARNTEYSGDIASLDQDMGGNGESNSINSVLGVSMSNYWRKFPNNFVYSGIMNGSSIGSRGSEGYFWTTTAFDEEKAYGASINESFINPGVNAYLKYYGLSIRCIAE